MACRNTGGGGARGADESTVQAKWPQWRGCMLLPALVPLAISMQEYTGTLVSCYNVRGPCAKATCCGVVIGCDSRSYLAWVLLVAPKRQASFPLHHDPFFLCAPIIISRSCSYLCASSRLYLSHSAIFLLGELWAQEASDVPVELYLH